MTKLIKQLIKFWGLSGIGWMMDLGVYMLLALFSSNLMVDNMVSSWVGVSFVFIFSTRYVFHNESYVPLLGKYIIYLLYQLILIWGISYLLSIIHQIILQPLSILGYATIAVIGAKIIVTPITMVLNFIFMKEIIEKF